MFDVEAVRVSAQLTELPFRAAVRVAVWLLPTLPACTENDAPVDPPATVTDAGTVRGALPPNLIDTAAPLLSAALDSVTVHTEVACEARALGLHAKLLTVGGLAGGGGGGSGVNCKETLCEPPFKDATRVALVVAFTAGAVALNAAVVAPCAIVTEAGTLTLAPLPVVPSAIKSPPLAAGAEAVTLQDAVPGVVRGFGEHVSAVNEYG